MSIIDALVTEVELRAEGAPDADAVQRIFVEYVTELQQVIKDPSALVEAINRKRKEMKLAKRNVTPSGELDITEVLGGDSMLPGSNPLAE